MARFFRSSLFFSLLFVGTGQADDHSPWSERFVAPAEIITDRVRLEPLKPDHTSLDFEAVMGSRNHLRKALQWGGWPPEDMTLADNRKALQNHWNEFQRREAYAYTVLSIDGETCLGCIYIEPLVSNKFALDVAFWVTEDQLATRLDHHIARTLIGEFESSWPVNEVEFSIPSQYERGIEVFNELGLKTKSRNKQLTVFVWNRKD